MGIPRSGTTWAFNVLRNIYSARGQKYETMNPQGIRETDEALHSVPESSNIIIHFHDVTQKVIECAREQNCVAFFNFRDPRDVVVSLMHLHDATFSEAVRMTTSAFNSMQSASRIPNLMLIPYEHIGVHAEALIFQMGLRLGQYLPPAIVSEIADRNNITKHLKIMEQVSSDDEHSGARVKSIFSGRRNVQYDTETLITDRHIQSGKSGRWRDELDDQEQEHLNLAFTAIVEQLGFD